MTLLDELKQQEQNMIGIRRELHRMAELSNQEFKTTEYIKNKLSLYPVEINDFGMKTGVAALLRGDNPGPTIALRADIDALPIKEDSGLDFSSEAEGVSHACGHDLHAAALLSALHYLSGRREELHGNVWFFFQPAEEALNGAKSMIDAGCLNQDPMPESILCYHCFPSIKTGKFGIIRRGANTSCDNFKITITSSGGHGAYPHRCGDPIVAASQLISQLQTAVSRDNDCMMPSVLTIGSIHGGTAPNIIPTKVELMGTMRAVYAQSRDQIRRSIERISAHTCAAMRTEVSVEFLEPSIAAVYNSDKCIDRAEAAIRSLFGEDAIQQMAFPTAGSEDFAAYTEKIPGALIRFGTQCADDPNTAMGVHTPFIRFDERSLYYATAVFCKYVLDYLK